MVIEKATPQSPVPTGTEDKGLSPHQTFQLPEGKGEEVHLKDTAKDTPQLPVGH